MAPTRPAASAVGSPEVLEVRCVGCGENLEVDPGLTEFICPDCATPQSLPPELLPTPPRRKALPLPRSAADVRGARLPCGSCGALLSVPVGLARCACPICGAELAVDIERLRHYLLSSAEGAIPVVPVGASVPPILQAREVRQEHPNSGIRAGFLRTEPDNQLNCKEQVQTKRPNQLIPEQADVGNPDYMVDGEDVHDVNSTVTRPSKQKDKHSLDPGLVSAEKRYKEPLNHVWHRAQVQCSTTHVNWTTGCSTALEAVNIQKRQPQIPNQIIQQSQKQSYCYPICTESAHAEDADGVFHVQERQQQHVNQANHTEELCTQVVNEIIPGESNRRRVKCAARSDVTVAEKRKVQEANEAIKQVQRQQSDSVIHMESENPVIRVEKEPANSFSCRALKRKKKGLTAASNSGLELRRSKRLAKDSLPSIDQEPDQNEFLELPASPGGQASDAVIDTEPICWGSLESQKRTFTSYIPASITYSEPTESDPDEQPAGSPDQSLSDSPDIDRIIKNICPSVSPRQDMPETSSNKLDSLHLTTPPSYSDLDMCDPEQFARNYVPPLVRQALAKLRSNSLLEHPISQASSSEACLHDLTDPEGDDPWIPTSQKIGTKRSLRGLTLRLEVWTLPKGVRIPVSLNTSGQPVGKEAVTLTNFLCAIVRDGILAPLIYQDWRHVPEKNKDIIWRIVKLKFDIAPIGELWVMKSLGKRWRNWKSNLKIKHYDSHETEEERLADRNPRVLKEQWRFLVAYWSTEKAKATSARNQANAANMVAPHTAGTKSFARIIEEERQKRPNKDGPTVADFFELTHTHKNGKPTKKATADIIARLREESQKQTEGLGSGSTGYKFGLKSSSKAPRGKTALKLKACFQEAVEAKTRAEEEAAALKEKMMAMEESQKKMQEDLANMKSTVGAIHKTVPSGDLPDQHMPVPPGFPTVNTPIQL